TVMGHVDHGKTSLLDFIRKTNVVGDEAGAITQHIGAYIVKNKGGNITFIDTPGHEAFTAMRARGAQVTDMVVLVVAADDGVKPQTIEAIDHARAANVPIIVAINKIDKPTANVESIKQQLSNHNLSPEEWGGKTIMAEISAKTGQGIDNLLEMILLQAEMLDLKADPTIRGQGIVIEAKLEKGRGPSCTVIVQKGSVNTSDPVCAGTFYGRIRVMLGDMENKLESVGPSAPMRFTGLNGVPQAGDSFMVVKDDQEARQISTKRAQIKREYEIRRGFGRATLENIYAQIKDGQIKELRLIIKADVDGSAEVLADTLSKIRTDEVRTTILHKGVGAVTESNVLLAATSGAIIIGFNVTPDARAREMAAKEKVDIRKYDIIYEVESDVRKALEGMLAPEEKEVFSGLAEVRQVFKVPKIGAVAGCFVKEGTIKRVNKVHITREGIIIHTGDLVSLRRFKDDAREVTNGYECGIGIENFNDIKVGDLIEAYEIEEIARTLEDSQNKDVT
ncbi:MAG: translation initiation factor IF-2, partial [candidate division Zixibacteria bacterium]|nr:translation initiation factor IF-2 [candidate division Zixibacteria bacterium]